MIKTVVYTMDFCPFCERAKRLLQQRGILFEEKRVPMSDDEQWKELEKRSGLKTMPQIFHNGELVGGFSELQALDQKNHLNSLK